MTSRENSGSIRSGRELRAELDLEADVVVVGSGAGGGMVAMELAQRGASVVVLEEGPLLHAGDMTQREVEMLPKLYQERGTRSTSDYAIRVMGGRCVGGSTVHNINLCKRAPREILHTWAKRFRVSGCSAEEMAKAFASVERDLSVAEIPAASRNRNNQLLERGVTELGWAGGPLMHNRVGCRGSGYCEIGCPYDAKQNAAKVLIPRALQAGARVMSDVFVRRVLHRNGSVAGVEGWALVDGTRAGPAVRVSTRHVVLAGSAIGSAAVALRSALPDPYDVAGCGLQLHPGAAVAGYFKERVDGFTGIPQSFECTEWLDFSEKSTRRTWITTAMAHPIGASTTLPGFGLAHRQWMLRYPHLGALTAMVHDHSRGRVRLQADRRPRIDYALQKSDIVELSRGVRECARLLLAAGASEVLVPTVGGRVLKTMRQVDQLGPDVAAPHNLPIVSVHPMGSLPFGDDPRTAVVNSQGEHHQMAGLHVCDSSLFPCGVGVPPQLTVYALARHLSSFIGAKVAER